MGDMTESWAQLEQSQFMNALIINEPDWEQLKALVAKELLFTASFTEEALFTLIANKPPLPAPVAEGADEALTNLNVEDSSLPDLCAEVIILDSPDVPLVRKAQGSDNSLSQDLDLAKRSLKDGSLTPFFFRQGFDYFDCQRLVFYYVLRLKMYPLDTS